MINIISDFASLFFPRCCASCHTTLARHEQLICLKCEYELPRTNFHKHVQNDVAQLFWGRVQIDYATAFLYFQKKGHVQKLLHKLKYKGKKEIGIELGRRFARDLKNTEFELIDTIVPVPLHKKRERKRGYNQSEMIAQGLSEILQKPIDTHSLVRVSNNRTQTRKTRYERWENVENLFEHRNPQSITGKHILLVDDVVTTGATLEACAAALLKVPDVKVSIAVLAKA